jgi:GrpB-like predicted nucleotidyltransferase (UPF0157 family)
MEEPAVMITIVPYRATWPDEFAEIGRTLREALGPLALRIDHIGSTAVPGLAAKDRIDIQITVESLAPAVEQALRRAGYERFGGVARDHVPPGSGADPDQWVKWFFRPAAPGRAINVHVRIQGRANQRYPLLFRDYLRAHPASAEAYARLKLHLARLFDDTGVYADVKDPACDLIALAAEDWATATDWRPGPSDA